MTTLLHCCMAQKPRHPTRGTYEPWRPGKTACPIQKSLTGPTHLALKQCNILHTALESLAADRHTWRSSCHQGTTHLQEQATERRTQRRALRHQRAAGPTPSSATYLCPSLPLSHKTCRSRIGLHSHMAMHRRNTTQSMSIQYIWSNVVIEIDRLRV